MHAQLVRMDNRFRARLLRAFKRGKENRQAAAATYDANRANLTGQCEETMRTVMVFASVLLWGQRSRMSDTSRQPIRHQ